MAAWAEMFGAFLGGLDTSRPGFEDADTSPYTDADYFAHVDGKPRYEGVADLLAARGITLPQGSPEDPASAETVCGLGNRKNGAFRTVLERDGVRPYPGSVALLDHLRDLGTPLAVVSSSANAPAVLAAAGLTDRFVTVVDGQVARELGLAGKPAPDTFLHAAQVCGAEPSTAVVVEDAVSGVRAGAAGHVGLVVGVDRGAGAEALTAAGADLVVPDLGELA
ncbi:HAD-IA family hydrolase [Arthrobacter sp. NEB 688]|uniref:HAD family hydrolase n=1 Tax=Arthrobacter sp. NEB 688 TaxID=904039 RepID=UPI00256FE0CF|nr:HAD-IA family hydrolase [Arthrobacter sp. NEB 688]